MSETAIKNKIRNQMKEYFEDIPDIEMVVFGTDAFEEIAQKNLDKALLVIITGESRSEQNSLNRNFTRTDFIIGLFHEEIEDKENRQDTLMGIVMEKLLSKTKTGFGDLFVHQKPNIVDNKGDNVPDSLIGAGAAIFPNNTNIMSSSLEFEIYYSVVSDNYNVGE